MVALELGEPNTFSLAMGRRATRLARSNELDEQLAMDVRSAPPARAAPLPVRARALRRGAPLRTVAILCFLSCRATVHQAGGRSPARSALTAPFPCAADCGFVGGDGGPIYGDACLWGSVGRLRAAGEFVGGRARGRDASFGIPKGGGSLRGPVWDQLRQSGDEDLCEVA